MSLFFDQSQLNDFRAIQLKVASPEIIRSWSHGEVTKPETINYRTQKAEKDGLFCERIFGPSKDFECYCGKYRRIRYKGIICDKCGVEVTRAAVRRERFGHIELAAPVAHIWFLRGVPSKLSLLLDISVQNLEKVVYFAQFVIISVNEELRQTSLEQVTVEFEQKLKQIKADLDNQLHQSEATSNSSITEKAQVRYQENLDKLLRAKEAAENELAMLQPKMLLSEELYQDLSYKYGHVFEANMGAEAIYELLKLEDDEAISQIAEQLSDSESVATTRRLSKRLKLLKSIKTQGIKPEWLILTVLPVIPPDLRPMVPLDGGRFATSDLNDLYRRIINRNNRLKRLQELNAPEIICRNEKRMLQEAVDALIDNSARTGKTTAATGTGRQLKSLADMLKGKQGRFRQNLLGKRVDYSGRSVIVVGPTLKLHQCGLPKTMALELFRPFVISELIKRELAHNVRSANRIIDSGRNEIWDILEEITKNNHVLLNRAPTLHRLGIQAFQPVLIEGKAIQIHPLVCTAFNADFDGDQMAVHVPLTAEAREEAATIMRSDKNLLKPASGEPVTMPNQDMVLGAYYLTYLPDVLPEEKDLKTFSSRQDVILAHSCGVVKTQQPVVVRLEDGSRVVTSPGRIIFHTVIPEALGFWNVAMKKSVLKKLVYNALRILGPEESVKFLDNIKNITFKYLSRSGTSWSLSDLPNLSKVKAVIFERADNDTQQAESYFQMGFLTAEERHSKIVEIWHAVKIEITKLVKTSFSEHSSVKAMVESEARGSWEQMTQVVGIKGLVASSSGVEMELPVKASFQDGLNMLEYFISTHGTRKALSDTALKTADAGYLTRRLVDVVQDMVISEEDCGEKEGLLLVEKDLPPTGQDLVDHLWGRVTATDVKDETGLVVIPKDTLVTEELRDELKKNKVVIAEARIRSALMCLCVRGMCRKCYGYDLGYNKLVEKGTAVGIIAAQSIGEPGTQLTMRTFHTGGVASAADITQGLPRVEEIFEARIVKSPALLAPFSGLVEVIKQAKQQVIRLQARGLATVPLTTSKKAEWLVSDGEKVEEGQHLGTLGKKKIIASITSVFKISSAGPILEYNLEQTLDLLVPMGFAVLVSDGDKVAQGQQLTEGNVDLHDAYKIKGREAVQKYIISEIKTIYYQQAGEVLADKHVEVIARQMFSREIITDSGDTILLLGDVVTTTQVIEANNKAKSEGGQVAKSEKLLLGITKASLATESFLSAASFRETAKVLIDAATTGRIDYLRGLKENVIIGRLIPAGTGYKKIVEKK